MTNHITVGCFVILGIFTLVLGNLSLRIVDLQPTPARRLSRVIVPLYLLISFFDAIVAFACGQPQLMLAFFGNLALMHLTLEAVRERRRS